jgi:hypothetical protein
MDDDFSKLQGVLTFVFQIVPADNLEGFKMQLTTKSQHQNHKKQRGRDYSVFTCLCHSLIPRIPLAKTKLII